MILCNRSNGAKVGGACAVHYSTRKHDGPHSQGCRAFWLAKVGAINNPNNHGIGQTIRIVTKPVMSKYRPESSVPVPGGLDIVTRTWATLHNLSKQLLRAIKLNKHMRNLDLIKAEMLDMVHP